MSAETTRETRIRRLLLPGGLLIGAALAAVMSVYLIPGVDWHQTFRPAALALLRTGSPYDVPGYLNPPWAILPLIPLALLPERVGRALYLLMSLGAFAWAAHRLGAKPVAFAAFLCSPPIMASLINGNNDWLVVVGFALPPQWGLFLIAAKPQMGVAVGVYWLVEAWRRGAVAGGWRGGWKEALRVVGPFAAALALSFALYGWWPLRFGQSVAWGSQLNLNISWWPLSLPLGLALLARAVEQRDASPAMVASPALAPYVMLPSWSGPLAAVLRSDAQTVAAVAGLWIILAMQFV